LLVGTIPLKTEEKNHNIFQSSARYAYENCVYNSARARCLPGSAKFTRSLVELLSSERQFKNCGRIEVELCGAADKAKHYISLVFIGLMIEFLFIKLLNSVLNFKFEKKEATFLRFF
jgi:hypothetical protein